VVANVQEAIADDGIAQVLISVTQDQSDSQSKVEQRRDEVNRELLEDGLTSRSLLAPHLVSADIDVVALDNLSRDPNVASIEPRTFVTPTLSESTEVVGAQDACTLDNGYRGSGQKIAIIDSG